MKERVHGAILAAAVFATIGAGADRPDDEPQDLWPLFDRCRQDLAETEGHEPEDRDFSRQVDCGDVARKLAEKATGDEPLSLVLSTPTDRWSGEEMFLPIGPGRKLSGAEPLTFSRLQRGRYEVTLFGRAGAWTSGVVTLGAKPATLVCGVLEGRP